MNRYKLKKVKPNQFKLIDPEGCAVADVKKRKYDYPKFVLKFYTERSRDLFDTYCDSISMSECCEAMETHHE